MSKINEKTIQSAIQRLRDITRLVQEFDMMTKNLTTAESAVVGGIVFGISCPYENLELDGFLASPAAMAALIQRLTFKYNNPGARTSQDPIVDFMNKPKDKDKLPN